MTETISTQYTTREMLDALNIAVPPTTFLIDRLIKKTQTHTTRYVEIDVVTGSKTKAAYVSRVGPAEVVEKPGYDSKIHVLPYTKQRMVLTVEDLETRLPGQTVYDAGSPRQRMDYLLGQWLGMLKQRITRTEEYQIAQALITGKATISGNGVEYEIDYGRDSGSSVTLTGGDCWDQTATRDIPADIRNASIQMNVDGVDGGDPSLLVLGFGAANNFMNEATTTDTELKNSLDMRRVDRGEIDVKYLRDQKVTYLGNYRDVGVDIDIVCYKGKYTNSAGTEVYYIPENDAVFVNESLRAEKHYSMISNLKSNFVGEAFPSSWIEDDGSAEYLQLESGPLAAVHEINATYYLKTV